jgi:hypothetical protein
MCFSCPKPLVKMDIPFGQCWHFGQVGLLKSHDFLWCLFLRDEKRLDWKQKMLSKLVDVIEQMFDNEIKGIIQTRQTHMWNKEYLVKHKGYHPKE